MSCGNGKCDVMEVVKKGQNTMLNGRSKIKARTTEVKLGGDACGCGFPQVPPVHVPPSPPVVVQVPVPPVEVKVPVPVPVPSRQPEPPTGTPVLTRQPEPPTGTPVLTRQPDPSPRMPPTEKTPPTFTVGVQPVFPPNGKIPQGTPAVAPLDPYCQDRLNKVYGGDRARMEREDELCTSQGGNGPAPVAPAPNGIINSPRGIPTADKFAAPTEGVVVAVSQGVGRDKVKTRANAGVLGVSTRLENPGKAMQLHGMPVAPKRQAVRSIGFINIAPGMRIYRAVMQGGQWVPGGDLTGVNGRWVQLRNGNSAYLIDHDLYSAENFVLLFRPDPNGIYGNNPLGYFVVTLDPNGSEVLDGVAYADLSPLPLGNPSFSGGQEIGKPPQAGSPIPGVSAVYPKGSAPATGCGGRNIVFVNEEEFAGAGFLSGCGGKKRAWEAAHAPSQGVAPAGCPGGCGMGTRRQYAKISADPELPLIDGACSGGCPTAYNGSGGCGGCKKEGCKKCRVALEPLWVHGPGYASATGLPAGWAGPTHDIRSAQNMLECQSVGGTWDGNGCRAPLGDIEGDTAATEQTCEASGKHWVNGRCQVAAEGGGISNANQGAIISGIGNLAHDIISAAVHFNDTDQAAETTRRAQDLLAQAQRLQSQGSSAESNAQLMQVLTQMQSLAAANNVVPSVPPKDNTTLYAILAGVGLLAFYVVSQKKSE